MMPEAKLLLGDCVEVLRTLEENSVHCVVTSPPYFGLRNYGVDGQLGLEETPAEYVEKLVAVFQEIKRVLREDGTAWLNLGDSYASSSKGQGGKTNSTLNAKRDACGNLSEDRKSQPSMSSILKFDLNKCGLKSKDLIGIPWRVAFALQEDGWYLRSDIVWHKCLSGGAIVYAKTQKGEMPMMVKDMVRLDPSTVKLWDGEKWNQVHSWEETSPAQDRQAKSAKAKRDRYEGKEAVVLGDIEIELRSGERIGCTRNHKWPTRRGIIQADQLRIGDVLDTTTLPEPKNPRTPKLLPDDDIGWFVGLYIAEGSQSEGTIQISSHIKEAERFERLQTIAAKYDGYCARFKTSENGATININSPVLIGVIKAYVSGKTAKTKHLDIRCWKRSNAFLRAVFAGYLDGDGHKVKPGFWRLGFTNNDALTSDLRTIAARVGYSLRLRRRKAYIGSKGYPIWRGDLRMNPDERRTADSQIVAIRQSRARKFWNISLVDEPHTFCLASGICTKNSNPMPESVRDRPTKAHEYIFLLSQRPQYYYDAYAVRDPVSQTAGAIARIKSFDLSKQTKRAQMQSLLSSTLGTRNETGRNKRSVWTVATKSFREAHFATYPPELITPCILAGTSEAGCCPECGKPWERVVVRKTTGGWNTKAGIHGQQIHRPGASHDLGMTQSFTTGWQQSCDCPPADPIPCTVIDPFNGAGTTGLVALRYGRSYIGIDINPDYLEMTERRLATVKAQMPLPMPVSRKEEEVEQLGLFDG